MRWNEGGFFEMRRTDCDRFHKAYNPDFVPKVPVRLGTAPMCEPNSTDSPADIRCNKRTLPPTDDSKHSHVMDTRYPQRSRCPTVRMLFLYHRSVRCIICCLILHRHIIDSGSNTSTDVFSVTGSSDGSREVSVGETECSAGDTWGAGGTKRVTRRRTTKLEPRNNATNTEIAAVARTKQMVC